MYKYVHTHMYVCIHTYVYRLHIRTDVCVICMLCVCMYVYANGVPDQGGQSAQDQGPGSRIRPLPLAIGQTDKDLPEHSSEDQATGVRPRPKVIPC
jgi:hypothetical protein